MNWTKNEKLNIAVIGTGSIGTILAGCLAKAGHNVSISDINVDIVNTIKAKGIKITGSLDIDTHVTHVCVADEIWEHKPFDVILLVVKAPIIEKISSMVSKHMTDQTICVCACNGIGSEQAIIDSVGSKSVYRMVINAAASLESPGHVNLIAIMGDSLIGACDPSQIEKAKILAQRFSQAQFEVKVADNIQNEVWIKTILNASMSAVCAITRLTMSQSINHPVGQEFVKRVLHECIEVALKQKISIPEGFFDNAIGYLKSAGNHYPSMYWDLWQGGIVEIDFLNQAFVKFGEKLGVSTPYNFSLVTMIKLMMDAIKRKSTELK